MSLISHEMLEPQEQSEDMYYEDSDTAGSLRQIPKAKMYTENGQDSHPGVILLGRGNSFTLGRSEVIFLHKRKSEEKSKASEGENNRTQSVDADSSDRHEQHLVPHSSLNSLTPPPISNGDHGDMTRIRDETRFNDDLGLNYKESKEVDLLWDKVESVMFAKHAAVQEILEDFGIGGTGGGEEQGLEEENIWQVVEEHFRV